MQNPNTRNSPAKPFLLKRRSLLKTALAAGLAGVSTYYGINWLAGGFKGGPKSFAKADFPGRALAGEAPAPLPPLDQMVPADLATAAFAMG